MSDLLFEIKAKTAAISTIDHKQFVDKMVHLAIDADNKFALQKAEHEKAIIALKEEVEQLKSKKSGCNTPVPYGSPVRKSSVNIFFKRIGRAGWLCLCGCLLTSIIVFGFVSYSKYSHETERLEAEKQAELEKSYMISIIVEPGYASAMNEFNDKLVKMYSNGWEFHENKGNSIVLKKKR